MEPTSDIPRDFWDALNLYSKTRMEIVDERKHKEWPEDAE